VSSHRTAGSDSILEVRNLRKHYPIQSGLVGTEVGRVRAVDGISFDVRRGETLGLVGESGCGKSTAATSLLRLEEPTLYDPDALKEARKAVYGEGIGTTLRKLVGRYGTPDLDSVPDDVRRRMEDSRTAVRFNGEDITQFDDRELKRFRRNAQMIFQDPTSSFDRRMTIGESAAEGLRVQGISDRETRRRIVQDLFERVGMSAEDVDRYPHEFSGGQKQRVALARALVVNPELIVADEPVSALDVSVQANILNLMRDLQEEFGLSILFISHDMGVVREICDRVAVMYLGEIVEIGPTEELFRNPKHPYTRALLSSIPIPDPRQRGLGTELIGDVPSASAPPSGCRFHTRCPELIQPEAYDLDQEHWTYVMNFREMVRRGKVDVEALREAIAIRKNGAEGDPDAVGTEELRAEVREEFDLPERLSDPGAEEVLSRAIGSVVEGEFASATETLSEHFSTVCEREKPMLARLEPQHEAACHRNDGTPSKAVDAAEGTPVMSRDVE
jgi:peptide/nickel transport system ATP-binding protein